MTLPKVSVVMSVYNGGRHLPAALESLRVQDFSDFEIIAVNDGSTDDSASILQAWRAKEPRLRVFDQPNAGLTLALIRGCQEARGEFIARQDADDLSLPTRLRRQLKLFDQHPHASMISCQGEFIDDHGDRVDVIDRPTDPQTATHGLLHKRKGPPAHGTIMMRRSLYEAVGGYRACFYYGQDSDLWLRLAQHGPIVYADEILYQARMSPTGISSVRQVWQHQFGELGQMAHAARLAGQSDQPFVEQAEELRQQLLQRPPSAPEVRKLQSAAYYRMGTMLARQGNRRARECFWSAVKANPWHWRSWCRLGLELMRVNAS